ncbi:SLC13 family permease [Vibrio salinus]|uniref:SLC13 family permease n=1 Tax=Vibrio salinus TaxID=2899784 RepID=UPI001E60F5D6|nr:SLC13 family permease [Vibrio salinus]MCE0495693.1 SLC13 family permease [Vibrio salinus]
MDDNLILIFGAILASLIIGIYKKINIGIIALVFAYIIGCFFMGMKPKAVIALWPMKIFFIIMSVSLFYGFASQNGTLEKLAKQIIYSCRKYPMALPLAIFAAAHVIAALGAGYFAVMAVVIPIMLAICKQTKMSIIVGILATHGGALSGGRFVISVGGKIAEELVLNSGFDANYAAHTALMIYTTVTLYTLLQMGLFFILEKQWLVLNVNAAMEKPEPFNKVQRTNLILIGSMIAVLLVPALLNVLIGTPEIAAFQKNINISFVAIFFAILSLMCNLGDEKKMISSVPWSTIIMICGIGVLIKLGVKAGMVVTFSSWVGGNIPESLLAPLMMVIPWGMSFFSSTTGVVMPTLYPIVPALSDVSTIQAIVFFCIISLGANAAALSPFSSGGSLSLSYCNDEQTREVLFKKLLLLPFILIALTVVYGLALVVVLG